MNRGRYRWLFRLAVVFAVGIGYLAWSLTREHVQRITVENLSGQPIVSLQVSIGGETRSFKDIRAGGEITATFKNKAAQRFLIKGQFLDGSMLSATSAEDEFLSVTIQPGGQIKFNKVGK
jgi:hypothetical protein